MNIVVIRDDLKDKGMVCLFTSIPSMQLVDLFFQGGDDVLWASNSFIEGLRRVLAAPYFSQFGGGWFSLSVEIPFLAGQWFHTHPGPL